MGEDLGYRVNKVDTVSGWPRVCGCALNPETGYVQFNGYNHPHYCYNSAQQVNAQDKDSRQKGLISLCYKKGPVEHARLINYDNYYFNPAGVGKGRCEAGVSDMILSAKECEYAVKSLGHEVASVDTVSGWNKVCGCSYNAETDHVQFNTFVHPVYCY